MPYPADLTTTDFPLPPLDAEGKLLAVGDSVRILSVASCAKGLPAEDQERLFALVGKVRLVMELDRSGFVWLSFSADAPSSDFCLFPCEVALVTPDPIIKAGKGFMSGVHKKTPLLRISAIIILGVSAPYWWTYAVSNLIFGIFRIAGSPAQPSAAFAWASILGPNIMLGLLTGYVLTRLSASSLKGWLLFWATLLGGIFIPSLLAGESVSLLPQALISPGNIAFLIATGTLPLFRAPRQANSGKTKPRIR